jgi:hypothetical protein
MQERAHPIQVCDADDGAPWRTQRLTTSALLLRESLRGKKISPIFSVFGVYNTLFKVDWLHCADQGIAADFLGNLFCYIVQRGKVPGANELDRAKALGVDVFAYYEEYHVQDRVKDFLPKTFKGKKASIPPKLKGSAATVRSLVKFGVIAANKYLSGEIEVEASMIDAAHHLNNCYESLRASNQFLAFDALYNSSKRFAHQFNALWHAHGKGAKFRPMPKMHMFLELCSSRTEPSKFWCYRDEDFGGSVSRQSRMKGRWKKLSAFCRHALNLFRMKNSAPRMVSETL